MAVALPPLLIIPVQIYSGNPFEFPVALPDLFPGLIGVALAVVAAVAGVIVLLATRWYVLTVAVVLGLAVMVWLQGQILVWNYGVMDGQAIDWNAWPVRVAVDSLLWLAIPLLAVIGRRHLVPHAALVGLILVAIQALPAFWAWHGAPSQPEFHRYSLAGDHKFSFSAERNAILLILDGYQTDIFHRIIEEEPAWRNELDGFTYFRNALAGYAKTYPSLSLLLTGQWYDNSEPLQSFIRRSFTDRSVPGTLLRDGWRVDLFPHLKRVVYPVPQVASNAVAAFGCPERAQATGRLIDLGLFRVSPHWLKSFWLDDYRWRLGRSLPRLCPPNGGPTHSGTGPRGDHAVLRFLRDLEQHSGTGSAQPAFKLYHLLIPHAPFHLDENLRTARLPGGREGLEQQSRAALKVVRSLLDRLRELGIYDQTMVAIVSDHGAGEHTELVDRAVLGLQAGDEVLDDSAVPPGHLASGLPLVLIKPPASTGELLISDAPVSLGDLARTMASMLKLDRDFPGSDMFELPEHAERTRVYRHYSFSGWSGEYLPEMIEYQVDGFSWMAGNWRPTGRRLAPSGPVRPAPAMAVEPGEAFRFYPGSPRAAYLIEGWSEPEGDGLVWSNSSGARIELPFKEPMDGDLLLRIDYLPFTARGAIESPRVKVTVNGELQHVWSTPRRGWRELQLPADVVREADSLQLDFRFPDAASPLELELSGDARMLGIAIYGMQLDYAFEAGSNEH